MVVWSERGDLSREVDKLGGHGWTDIYEMRRRLQEKVHSIISNDASRVWHLSLGVTISLTLPREDTGSELCPRFVQVTGDESKARRPESVLRGWVSICRSLCLSPSANFGIAACIKNLAPPAFAYLRPYAIVSNNTNPLEAIRPFRLPFTISFFCPVRHFF
ncbi:hypothetical protein BDV26DRAFT_125531 [Aspergillus bertholletiae]|uniref:Uncharacterized protein n=1 Tax=Aspergillus bertholletiae TaxID=1226010 RepID=A0A5N7APA5_9EURO|nr:hypothetical protein BDV26DRAFT_125531 [Aspergillus bertholletiae]